MFGDIKIDKLRFVYNKNALNINQRKKMDKELNYYFSDYAYSNKAGLILNNLNPAKLKRTTNLQMPLEDILFKVFDKVCLSDNSIKENSWITMLHLTKDILLKKPVEYYIKELSSKLYSRFKTDIVSSMGTNSLYLSYINSEDGEKIPKFRIKFYDKGQEYYQKHKTWIYPVQEKLSPVEIKELNKAYCKKRNTINLSKVNILRIEIELLGKGKLSLLTKALSKNNDKLSMKLFVETLKKRELYNKCDEVFNKIIEKAIFEERNRKKIPEKNDNITKLARNLIKDRQMLNFYVNVADELNLKESFSDLAKFIEQKFDTTLLDELYNNLFSKNTNEILTKNQSERSLTAKNNHAFSNKHKELSLLYPVPIKDSS